MLIEHRLAALAALLCACLAFECPAADSPGPRQKMKADQPMGTGMAKRGMKKGDVGKAAEKKARKLEPMMEQEEKSMPPGKPAQ